MIEEVGDIWAAYAAGEWIVITTNGITRARDGHAIMGRGIAKQAADRFPEFPRIFGHALVSGGNHATAWEQYRLITMPVKHHWRDRADLRLIETSARSVERIVTELRLRHCYTVRPGCGAGGRDWTTEVRPLIAPLFNDRFIVMERA